MFENLPDESLFMLKFQLLDHLFENMNRVGRLDYLDAFLYEHSNRAIKRLIQMTSMRKTSCVSKTVCAADKAFTTGVGHIGGKAEKRAFELLRDGVSTTLGCIYDSNI